jgi:uncharacterized membrane protein YphA (DoxX/SURF4 family)
MIEDAQALLTFFGIFGAVFGCIAVVCGLAIKFGDAAKHLEKWF